MKKRLFSLVLAVLFVLASTPLTSFADGGDVGVNINGQYTLQLGIDADTVTNEDETVTVDITVGVNGGFSGMIYQLAYDSSALSLEQQPVLGDIDGFEFVPGVIEDGKHVGLLSSAENVYESGTLITYTFTIKPEAKSDNYTITLLTDGVIETANGEQTLGVLDENLVKVVTNAPVSGEIVIPGYTVSYDANGGSGAPENQFKSRNDFVRISSDVPSKDGHMFLGWATSASAESAEYTAGDKYSEDKDLSLYAVWKKLDVVAGSIDVSVATVEAKAGEEVEVAISVSNHLGVGGMQFDVVFDDTQLKYVDSSLVKYDDDEFPDITLDEFMFTKPNVNAVTNKVTIGLISNVANLAGEGEVVKVKFEVLETADDGLTEVSVVPIEFLKYTGTNMEPAALIPNITNGGVDIITQLLGDIDLDEDVDIDDAILLFQHSMLPDVYPIGYKGDVDFTKNGTVDIDDAILLFQYSMLPDIYPIG